MVPINIHVVMLVIILGISGEMVEVMVIRVLMEVLWMSHRVGSCGIMVTQLLS